MDVRQLAALVAIADHGTFSAAARALFTVQSNVSSHVARLEKELGTVLVDRAHGGLTDDGARVVERARRVLHEIDDIAAEMAQRDGDVVGDVRLGMLGTTARWLLPRLLAEMSARHPQLRVIVAEGSTSVLIPALLSAQYDAAIVHLPVDDPELTIEPLFAEDLLLLAGDGHPLARRSTIHLAELAGSSPAPAATRIGAAPGPRPRRPLASAPTCEAEAEVDGVRLLATLAVDGHGAAIVPATAVPAALRRPLRHGARARAAAAGGRPHLTPAARPDRRGQGAVRRGARRAARRVRWSRPGSASAPTPSRSCVRTAR